MTAIHSRVVATTDRLSSEGVQRGQVGYVVNVWKDGALEIEFMRPDGTTIWLGPMSENEVAVADAE